MMIAHPSSHEPMLRHCEERSDKAIQSAARNGSGLLRYTRNDEIWGAK